MTTPLWSDLTVTDVFCGAGGNTIGAKRARARLCGERRCRSVWQRANALVREAKRRGEHLDLAVIVRQCAVTLAPELEGRDAA